MPPDPPYRGEVVVLTDLMSCSSSEEMAGGLQALGRAVVVGQKTTGVVLIADVVRLDLGATPRLPGGRDGPGRTARPSRAAASPPDIEVPLDRVSLAEGRDAQLEAALQFLREKTDSKE